MWSNFSKFRIKSLPTIRSISYVPGQENTRHIIFLSNGERVDHVFGNKWWANVINDEGFYTRRDLNLPTRLPRRTIQYLDGTAAYKNDPPLTSLGEFQSKWVGLSIKDSENSNIKAKFNIKHVFSSNAYSSIQTAYNFLIGINNNMLSINIEPGLCGWPGWNIWSPVKWIKADELNKMAMEEKMINLEYQPIYSTAQINQRTKDQELPYQYFTRCCDVMKGILKKTELAGGDIVIVSQPDSYHTCFNLLLNDENNMPIPKNVIDRTGYCSTKVLFQTSSSGKKWQTDELIIPKFTHLGNLLHTTLFYNFSPLNVITKNK